MKLKFCGFLHSGERWWFDSAVARLVKFLRVYLRFAARHWLTMRSERFLLAWHKCKLFSVFFFIVVDKFNGDDGSSAHRSAGQEPGPSQVESELTYPPAEWLNLCVARSSELINSSAPRRSPASILLILFFFLFFSSLFLPFRISSARSSPSWMGFCVFMKVKLRYFIYTLCARSALRICSNIKTLLAFFFQLANLGKM